MLQRRFLKVCLCCILGATLGCGVKTHPVSGMVVFEDDQPATELANGFVTFQADGDSPSTSGRAVIKADGTFRASTYQKDDGLVPGKHRVLIVPPPYFGPESKDLPPPTMDPRFHQFDTANLEVNVEGPVKNLLLKVERAKKQIRR